ncbi:MAG: UDP-N-acetylglucosamine 2-epimerase (non-hydrolyzing) [Gammaproteobacteria bacterium]|nr:UDP-N-acetylglucosamine 2-epimerase (non-hydrolyzing) [Gammaproteobacteria bacterium]
MTTQRIKVLTVVGTRPEIIRLSRVLALLDSKTDHVLVHTGQNYDYELNQIFFEQLKLRQPTYFLEAAGSTPMETIGTILTRIDPVLERERPDALLILGDTNSCLAVIAAKRRKIPIFHMEAGNRCFDDRVPEEINRRIVDHTSDINLTYSDLAREYLLREGLPPDRIVKTGSPMYEVLNHYRPGIDQSEIITRLELTTDEYYVVSVHREENIDSDQQVNNLVQILNRLVRETKRRVIVSTHPRTRKRVEALGVEFEKTVEFHMPFGFLDFVKLERHAHAVLSDSGTITEESSILNFPALNLREAHERPEGMEEGSVMLVGLNVDRVFQGLAMLEDQPRNEDRLLRVVSDYDVPNVSEKVLRLVISYVDYVNRVVWRKSHT